MTMRRVTKAQRALLARMSDGQLLIMNTGANGRSVFFIEHPYSAEDGRTCWPIIDAGLLRHAGGGMWIINDAGLAALQNAPKPEVASPQGSASSMGSGRSSIQSEDQP